MVLVKFNGPFPVLFPSYCLSQSTCVYLFTNVSEGLYWDVMEYIFSVTFIFTDVMSWHFKTNFFIIFIWQPIVTLLHCVFRPFMTLCQFWVMCSNEIFSFLSFQTVSLFTIYPFVLKVVLSESLVKLRCVCVIWDGSWVVFKIDLFFLPFFLIWFHFLKKVLEYGVTYSAPFKGCDLKQADRKEGNRRSGDKETIL